MKTYVENIVNYYPKNSGLHNYESSLLIELKKGGKYPQTYFFIELSNWIMENIQIHHTICVIPRHNGASHLKLMAKELCIKFQYLEDGTNCLQSKYDRKPLKLSKYRSKQIIINSISIDSDSIKGKHILLIDDIVTTGTTLSAVEDALLEKGAMTVHCLAIGKTWQPKVRGF